MPKNHADGHIMVEMPVGFPKKILLEESNAQLPKAESFNANNTLYYTCIIMPKPSICKIAVSAIMKSVAASIGFIRKYLKYIAVVVVIAMLFIFGNKGIGMYQSYQKEQAIKDSIEQVRQDSLKQDSIRKEQAIVKIERPTQIARETPKSEEQKQVKQKVEDIVKFKEEKKVPVNTLKVKTEDELFAEAKTFSDYKKLADKGYKKAYAPLSELYLKNKQYSLADVYAQKAYTSGVSVSRATKVMEILQLYGYYDDKKLPKVLEH